MHLQVVLQVPLVVLGGGKGAAAEEAKSVHADVEARQTVLEWSLVVEILDSFLDSHLHDAIMGLLCAEGLEDRQTLGASGGLCMLKCQHYRLKVRRLPVGVESESAQ